MWKRFGSLSCCSIGNSESGILQSSELEMLHDGARPALILNLGLRGDERVACFDILGDRAAVATTECTLGIWHWKWTLCLNGVVKRYSKISGGE